MENFHDVNKFEKTIKKKFINQFPYFKPPITAIQNQNKINELYFIPITVHRKI